jgi:hypothetical protein
MNHAFFSLSCAALLVAPQALAARDAAAAKNPVAKDSTPVPANVPPYVLKNRSTFENPGGSARVPFWPVGWSKQKPNTALPVAAVVEPKVTIDEKSFHVSSILLSNGTTPSLVVINQRPYAEGEFLRMPRGSGVRIRVERITENNVTLVNGDQKIIAPLRRTELNAHRPEDELLDPNR